MRELVSTMAIVLGCAVAGCGDDTGDSGNDAAGGRCSAFKACGGNIVGDWEIKDVCREDILSVFELGFVIEEPECDGVARSVEANVSGLYSFKKDGIAKSETTVQLDIDLLWSEACLSAIANGAKVDLKAACRAMEKVYSMQEQFEGAACSVKAGGCACLITGAPMTASDATEYEVEGNEFIDTSVGVSTPFCVEGDTLTINAGTDSVSVQITLVRK